MSSTIKGTVRSGSRSNPEDMMWQGVRSKAPNLINQTTSIGDNNERLNQTNDQSRQKYGIPSAQGEQSVYNSSMAYQHPTGLDKTNSMMSGTVKEEPNFPINTMGALTRKNLSLQQPPTALQAHQFATIVGSDDSIRGGRSQYTADSRKSSQKPSNKMKKIDYSDIPMAMVHKQKAMGMKGSRGQSLRGSRFTENHDIMMQSLPVDHHPNDLPNKANGNARFNSIDVNFKRQIDILKQGRAQSMLPANLSSQDEAPTRIKIQGGNFAAVLQHNDSIYQSSVNQSINSGLGLTPKRLQIDNRNESTGRKVAPFVNQTEQKAYANRVPPILLANENKMKYVGHKHQTQVMQQQDFTQPNVTYSHQTSPVGQQQQHPGTANGASFLSREPGSTAYSQPEDSMFQPSEASMSQQRSRFPPNVLPKIGSANPEMNNRFKRGTANPADQRSREVSDEKQLRGRQLSTAQPKNGFKFSKSHVQSQQQQRSRQTANQYNDTGFNWRKVDIRTNTNFDGSGGTAGKLLNGTFGATSASVHVPAAYRRPKKLSPGQLLDMMQQVDHKGPISHKIVNSAEFERLAQQQKDNDGGRPMVEKTIFIVKPIYIPVEVHTTTNKASEFARGGEANTGTLTGKKKIKVKNKVQKAIYMERPKPPNYTNSMSTALEPVNKPKKNTKDNSNSLTSSKAKRKQQAQIMKSRSPSPFNKSRNSAHYATEALNQSSVDQVSHYQQIRGLSPDKNQDDVRSNNTSRSRSQTKKVKKDLKHILESSSIIDKIFKKRMDKIETDKKFEAQKKATEDEEYKEVIDANKSLKASLLGKSTTSKITLTQQSGDPSASKQAIDDKSSMVSGKKPKKGPVDTQKEFLTTINDQLHTAGAGIQIIMEESKNAKWFLQRAKDQARLNKQYGHVRKWEVAPKTFEQTQLDAETINAAKMQSLKKGQTAQKAGKTPTGLSLVNDSAQKSTHMPRADMSKGSIAKFNDCPSGGGLSDRRWKSPMQQSLNDSDLKRRGGSLSPRDETKSPFTVRSGGRGSIGGNRGSVQKIGPEQDQELNQLTIERVQAMKIMTNKLRKVAKMPVEFENKFCSHLDPGTSAQLIAADDLARFDKNGKFNERWRDKEHTAHQEGQKEIPKNFYANFKTNLIRDAHFMAKAIIKHNRSTSPMMKSCLGTCESAANGGNSIQCGCKPKKISLKPKFRSYTGGVRSAFRSKNVLKTAHNLYQPYRPCRRTCCGNHNPLFHAQRMQREHLQKMHASATKLMIMSVIPERPYSADSTTRALWSYQKDIDYFKSTMHDEAKERSKNVRLRRQNTKQQRTQSIEGIEERGANEEEDPKGAIASQAGMSIGIGSIGQFTQSNMNLMQNKLNSSFMMDDAVSFSGVECKYLLSVLKNRAIQATKIKDEQFAKIYDKARMTLKIQMKKLLLKKQFLIIDKQYKLAENEKQTSENLIKVLARCLRMYEAQSEILKIINLIESRLEKLKLFGKIQQSDEPDENGIKKLYVELVRLSGRILAEIRILKTIEKTLDRPFMFSGKMYDMDHMHKQMKRKRLQIIGQLPHLEDCNELKMFMLAQGEMSDVRQLQREDVELAEDEPLWSESEDEDSDEEDHGATTVNSGEFKTLKRLNDSSHEKLQTSEFIRRNTTF